MCSPIGYKWGDKNILKFFYENTPVFAFPVLISRRVNKFLKIFWKTPPQNGFSGPYK